MSKTINLNHTVYEIANGNPEVLDILFELGFRDIVKPGMLNTVGRFMTLTKGAAMKNIDLDMIKERFLEKGYIVEDKSI